MPPSPDTTPPLSWQRLRVARDQIAERWPSPLRLRLAKRPTDVLYALLEDDDSILDVGAGDARRGQRIRQRYPGLSYTSVDPDPEADADHATVGRAGTGYNIGVMFEVLEHMPPADGISLLAQMRAALAPEGLIVVSVPSTHTPGRYLRDCTHVTPWAHDELGAALILAGFKVTALYRTYPAPLVQRIFRRLLLGPIGHLYGIDYAHSVVAVGTKTI